MRTRTWSDVVMALMIAACVAVVAEPQESQSANAATDGNVNDVATAARSLAVAVLFDGSRSADQHHADQRVAPTPSAADRAVANAANAAGNAARGIEMPFFSFGGDASAE